MAREILGDAMSTVDSRELSRFEVWEASVLYWSGELPATVKASQEENLSAIMDGRMSSAVFGR